MDGHNLRTARMATYRYTIIEPYIFLFLYYTLKSVSSYQLCCTQVYECTMWLLLLLLPINVLHVWQFYAFISWQCQIDMFSVVACTTGCMTCNSASLCLGCTTNYAPQSPSPPYACGGILKIWLPLLLQYFDIVPLVITKNSWDCVASVARCCFIVTI